MSVLQPVLRPVLQPILRSPFDPGLGASLGAVVQALFASGEKGVMFDLTRAANLYTDSARTTLVTASGDGVGSCTDLSPNGKHASSIGSARPTWNSAGYATFDALDDYLQTAAIDFSATDKITIIAALRKSAAGAFQHAAGLTANPDVSNGSFSFYAPSGVAGDYAVYLRGTAQVNTRPSSSYAPPIVNVVTGAMDLAGATIPDAIKFRVDGAGTAYGTTGGTTTGGGNFSNSALYVGARGGSTEFFNGRIYRLLVIGRALTTTERNAAERWAAQPVGIAIP